MNSHAPYRLIGGMLAIALVAAPWPVSAQAPAFVSAGAYAARHGIGAELGVSPHRRFGVLGRAEGPFAAEQAYWLGGRVNVSARPETTVYVAPFVGWHRCYPSEIGGAGSGCAGRGEWKAGSAVMGGFEFRASPASSWSIGAEAGRRFVEAGSRSRWTFAAIVRYRLFP